MAARGRETLFSWKISAAACWPAPSGGKEGDVYNLASGTEISIKSLAEQINDISGNAAGVKLMPPRPWDRSGKRFGSTGKAARELHFQAKTNLVEGLERTVAWTREHRDLIESAMARHADELARLTAP